MDTIVIGQNLTRELERAEARCWSEYYLSASKPLKRILGIHSNIIGGAYCGAMSHVDTLAFNRVLGVGLDYTIDEQMLSSIIEFYKGIGVPRFFLPLNPAAEPDYATEVLTDSGFECYNNWVKFYKKLDRPLPQTQTQFSITSVKPEESEQFDLIIKRSFDWQDEVSQVFSHTIGRPGWRHYFAKEGGQPIAAASLYFCGKIASLAIAGTLPDHRGKGAQTALVTSRLNEALVNGCEYIVVETAEDKPDKPSASNRNMKRFGFEMVYLRPNYIFYTR